MNRLDKLVISRTLEIATWENTRLVQRNAEAELATLKQQTGKNIAIFGSSNLTVSLLHAGLVDELRIMVNPIAGTSSGGLGGRGARADRRPAAERWTTMSGVGSSATSSTSVVAWSETPSSSATLALLRDTSAGLWDEPSTDWLMLDSVIEYAVDAADS